MEMYNCWSIAGLVLNSTNCPENFFDCGNERCIAHFWRCDGENDCGNWADEHFCKNDMSADIPKIKKSCPHNHKHCNDTKVTCIPNTWFCDGMNDCENGFDEHNCTKEMVQCKGFLCHNFECIPKKWKCNGIPDCNDASDEMDCRQPKAKQICDKEHGFYQCLTGECISHMKVCDNQTDCPQGDDEGTGCRPKGCQNKKCSQLCFIGPHGPQCYCLEGYHLGSDNTTCIDINECDNNRNTGVCSHFCINQDGGYKCACREDYQLIDNRTCIVKDNEPLLLFSNSEGIRGIYLRSKKFFPVYHSLGQTVGLDFLNSEERVFWINSDQDNSSIYSVRFNQEDFKPIVTNGLKAPEDIAIDWIGRNIYVTDPVLNAIVVCRIDVFICVSHLFRLLDQPRALVVDPSKGLIYWTEWGNSSGIYKAGMDGSRKEHIVKNFIWPNGLALDSLANRLYWTEAKMGKIEFLDLTTNERRTVISDNTLHPFALAVFEEWIYWSDWFTYSLERSHKLSRHNQTIIVREINEEIKGVHVIHPLRQKCSYNPCWLNSCSHMCVLAPERSHVCVCPEHLVLAKDKTTCLIKANDTFLIDKF